MDELAARNAVAAVNASRILRQNTGQPAKIISLLEDARAEHGDSLASIIHIGSAWNRLVRRVESVVEVITEVRRASSSHLQDTLYSSGSIRPSCKRIGWTP